LGPFKKDPDTIYFWELKSNYWNTKSSQTFPAGKIIGYKMENNAFILLKRPRNCCLWPGKIPRYEMENQSLYALQNLGN
jgi:hypothetical protein